MTDPKEQSLLHQVTEQMQVYDVHEEPVGRVAALYYGDSPEAATPADTPVEDELTEGIARDVSEIMEPTEALPEEVRARLRRYGFIRVDAGVLASDVYVLPDDIDHVDDDGVHLSISGDELLSR
jgi:hypothetical protein